MLILPWLPLEGEKYALVSVELVVRCCAHRNQGKCATYNLFVIEYGEMGKESHCRTKTLQQQHLCSCPVPIGNHHSPV